MAARKSRRRKYRNRGRFGFLFKVLSAAAVLAAIVLGSAVFFRVDSIQVVGNSRYTEGQIIEAAQVERGDNLFLMHKFNTERHILTRLPYVDSVSITRHLPAGLEIRVTECSAVVAIQPRAASACPRRRAQSSIPEVIFIRFSRVKSNHYAICSL